MPSARYVVPMVALTAATLAWIPARRFIDRAMRGRSARRGPKTQLALEVVCALPLVASGTLHLLRPSVFTVALWPWVPHPELVIILTGIPEWAGAIGLFLPSTRRAAARCLALLMIAIFPANIYIAGMTFGGLHMPSVPVRWAMQLAYIWLLLYTGEAAEGDALAPPAGRPDNLPASARP